MALEVVDKKNSTLIRPAVITMVQEYQIKVLFIGWPEKYAYWVDDDSCDIFPPGYCKKTGHPIECPLGELITKDTLNILLLKIHLVFNCVSYILIYTQILIFMSYLKTAVAHWDVVELAMLNAWMYLHI